MTSNQIAYQNMLIDAAETDAKIKNLEAQSEKLKAEGQSAAYQALVDELEYLYQKKFRYNKGNQMLRGWSDEMKDLGSGIWSIFPPIGITVKV